MAGQRQPTDLVVMNGRKHLTKAEIEARKNAEVVAPNDKVKPPSYLTPEQKKKFRKIAKELLEIKLIANVDCDALARLLIAQDQYIEITQQIRASDAAASATAGAKACEGIVDGLNTMVDTVTKKTCVLSIEDGILTIREA